MRELTSVEEIISELGGYKAVAALTGRGYKAVHQWKSAFKVFPKDTFVILQTQLGRRGCSASPSLWSMPERAPEHEKAAS